MQDYLIRLVSSFCDYVLIGNEYPAIVEFAAFQKVPKKKNKKPDAKKGTIEQGKKGSTSACSWHRIYFCK